MILYDGQSGVRERRQEDRNKGREEFSIFYFLVHYGSGGVIFAFRLEVKNLFKKPFRSFYDLMSLENSLESWKGAGG